MPLTRTYKKQNLKDQFKKKKSTSTIAYLPANSRTPYRILQEPNEWAQAYGHYNPKFEWCVGAEDGCEACAGNVKKKELWLLNALERKTGAVVLLQIPFSLAQQLFKRFERYGTVMDRDYELIREGSGLDTEYSADPMDRRRMDISRYLEKLLDPDEAIEAEMGGEEPASTKPSKKSRRRAEDDDDFDEDEDEEEFDEDDEEDEEEEDDDPPRRSSKSSPRTPARKSRTSAKPSKRRHEDEDDDEEEEEEEDYDGLDEFRPEKSSHPAARSSRTTAKKSSASRVVRRTR